MSVCVCVCIIFPPVWFCFQQIFISFTPVGIKCNKIAVFFSFSFPSPSVHPTTTTTLRLSSLSSALPFHQQHRGCTAEGQSRRRQQEEEEGRSSSSSAEGRGERAGWLWMVTRSCRVESAGTSHDSHAEPQDQTDPQRYVRWFVGSLDRSISPPPACLPDASVAGRVPLPIMQHCTSTG